MDEDEYVNDVFDNETPKDEDEIQDFEDYLKYYRIENDEDDIQELEF